MGKRNTDPLPEEVDLLRMEVQEWRRTKVGPGAAMPKAIWETAIRLARRFGVCRIARATGLDYVWLRKKLERRADPAPAAPQVAARTFLEVPADLVLTGKTGVMADCLEPASIPSAPSCTGRTACSTGPWRAHGWATCT